MLYLVPQNPPPPIIHCLVAVKANEALGALTASAAIPPTEAQDSGLKPADAPMAQVPEGFTVFPIGINVGRRNVLPGVLVRGREDGVQAIDFERWLLPYSAVIQALRLSTKVLPDNQVELRSAGIAVRIDPSRLQTDPELGLVFSVQDLRSLFGVEVIFDVNEYAIQLQAPWLNQASSTEPTELPVQLEGLPRIAASTLTLTAIEQRANASGTQSISPSYQGDLSAVGSILGGSWFVRLNQPELFSPESWRLAELRFQRQTDASDYIVGSQPPFWRSQNAGDYWGLTTIQRQGFVPQLQLYGGSDPRQRLQAAQMSRTVEGRAEPGTLVRLIRGFSERVIAEVLVDSSGIYRFENIQIDQQRLGGFYRVFLYPQGRLTAQPEIRDATFSNVPGQIPAGASAFIVSGGFQRDSLSARAGDLLGDFSNFQGGVAQRWGLTNSLTVGIGAVYDQSLRGLGDIFFQPSGFPLKVAVSVLTGTEDLPWDINAEVSFEPSRNFNARFTSDRFSNRFSAFWQVFPGVTLLATTDSRDATAFGAQVAFSSQNAFTFARVTLDTENRFRWNLFQRLGQLELRTTGNEIGSQSELSYRLSSNYNFGTGHFLVLNYDTRSQNDSDHLATLGWRYRSQQRSIDGNPRWEAQVGYSLGSRGSGLAASVGTTVLPGLLLRARYQGISVTSSESTFSLELVSSLNLQRGITAGDRRADYLRTQGGLMIQPFFDQNQNGRPDPGEEFYTDPNLVILNNQPIQSLLAEVKADRILMRLPPGTYRLDLDPAGFPPDWQASIEAYAVDVVAGNYTPVPVPLTRSYTVAGIVTDAQGKPLSGARVEAVRASGERLFSVTNDAGVYYLERLQQSAYIIQVDGKSAEPGSVELQDASAPFQELNLKKP